MSTGAGPAAMRGARSVIPNNPSANCFAMSTLELSGWSLPEASVARTHFGGRLGRRGGSGGKRLGRFRLVYANAVAVRVLRVVQRLIGGAHDRGERHEVVRYRPLGDADAKRRLILEVRDGRREVDGRERLPQLLHDLLRLRDLRLRQRDDELVAAVTEREVRLAERDADAVGERAEHVIAGSVTVRIVDLFELVHVDHDHR